MKIYKIELSSNEGKTKAEKHAEIKSKKDKGILDYKAAQVFQLQNGGPGPVADYETMAIVNEYNSQYEIILPDDPIIQETPQPVETI